MPFARDDAVAARLLLHRRGRIKYARDAGIRITAEHFVLGADRKQTGQAAADIIEISDPSGAAVGFRDCRTDVEHGSGIHLPAAVPPRRANTYQTSLLDRLDRLLL